MRRISIISFILAIVLLSVNGACAAEVSSYNFTYTGFDSITLDDETAIKGYTISMFDGAILFGITPAVLTAGGTMEFKQVTLGEQSGMEYPEGYGLVSTVLEFDIKNKAVYDNTRPFWLQMKFNSDTGTEKNIFYFDQGKGTWIKIPSKVNYETGYVRAAFHLPFAKLAVLEQNGFMREGFASWYRYKGCDCAASPDYPKGTRLLVTNVANGKEIVVTINDWGPERDIFPNRVIDLDLVAFNKIADKSIGVARVTADPYQEEMDTTLSSSSYRTISRSLYSAFKEPSLTVISNEKDWKNYWFNLHDGMMASPEYPLVDFTTEVVIAVSQGEHMTAGYGISITRVHADENGVLVVDYAEQVPDEGDVVAETITSPYDIIAYPKADGEIRFNLL